MIGRQQGLRLWFGFTIICLALLWLVLPVNPSHAGNELPNRNTPTPSRHDDDDDDTPLGAYIELKVTGAPPEAWSVVQWQDSAGGWHAVEGWQSELNANGTTRWWVAAKDFGTGPFRWVVTAGIDKPTLTNSQAFTLPGQANDLLRVMVSVRQ